MRTRSRREKVFGPGRTVPLDRNQKARITAYAKAWGRLHRQPGQKRLSCLSSVVSPFYDLAWPAAPQG